MHFRETGYRWRPAQHRIAIDALRPRLDLENTPGSLPEATELARRGRGERHRPDHGWDSLTPTELRVVELVAAGLPNREKLAVRTRAELAAAATARALGPAPHSSHRRTPSPEGS